VNWLAAAEAEMASQGHLSAATRPQVLTLVLTGDAAARSRALALLDAEKKVHPGYERLATPGEIAGQAALSDLARKLAAPAPALPPWPDARAWRR
jgi:hypothetical protein